MNNIETAEAVVQLGVEQGIWTVAQLGEREPGNYWADLIVVGGGMPVTVSASCWAEQKVSIRMNHLTRGNFSRKPNESLRSGEASPEAACSSARGAPAILKDFVRRMLKDAFAIELFGRMQAQVKNMEERRKVLDRAIADLAPLGYTPSSHFAVHESYVVDLLIRGPKNSGLPSPIKVYGTGSVTMSLSSHVDDLVDLLKRIKSDA